MHSDLADLDIFISHASDDSDSVARPLGKLLRAGGLSVWLDENELELGDSLGHEIDDAIANCQYGVVVLSPMFLTKEWTRRELNALLAREGMDRKIVLPVWHGVTKEMIEQSRPELSERKYVTTGGGIQAVADSIMRVLQQDAARSAQSGRSTIQELSGEWDLKKAEPLILGALKEREADIRDPDYWSPSGQKDPIWSRILGDRYLRYRRRETMIVVTASLEEGAKAHVHAPRLSLFEFARTSSGWALVDSSLAVTSWGAWGDVNDDEVKVFVIGDNNFALFLDGGYTAQGITVTTTTVQARIGDRYREILKVQTSMDNSGGIMPEHEGWRAVITTKPGTSAFYDLLVERKGQRGDRDFEETELFRFNGRNYVSGDVYR